MNTKTANYIKRNGKDLYVKLTKGNARLIYERVCGNCGRDFISNKTTAWYCSDSCRVMGYRKKKKLEKELAALEGIKKMYYEKYVLKKKG